MTLACLTMVLRLLTTSYAPYYTEDWKVWSSSHSTTVVHCTQGPQATAEGGATGNRGGKGGRGRTVTSSSLLTPHRDCQKPAYL